MTALLKALLVDRLNPRRLIIVTLLIAVSTLLIYSQPDAVQAVGRAIARLPTIIAMPALLIYALLVYGIAVFVPVLAVLITGKELVYAVIDSVNDARAAVRAIKRASERES